MSSDAPRQKTVAPCPFCGATWGNGLTVGYKGQPSTSWHVHCIPCKADGPDVWGAHADTANDAIDKWNRRFVVSETAPRPSVAAFVRNTMKSGTDAIDVPPIYSAPSVAATPSDLVKRIRAYSYVDAEAVEKLERELAAERDQREVSRKMIEGLCDLRDELKAQLAAATEQTAKFAASLTDESNRRRRAEAAQTPLGKVALPDAPGEINQCDGCARRLPLENGIHYEDTHAGHPVMCCTKELYGRHDMNPSRSEPQGGQE